MKLRATIFSHWRRVSIAVQRLIDHSWRKVTGLPLMRRSQITPKLYLGGQHNLRGLKQLRARGITAIVNMRLTQHYDLQAFTWLKVLHLPTPDTQAPSIEQLMRGIGFISLEIENGGAVYVHCRHGEGRGPTMALAYLLSTGLTYEAALSLVQQVRGFAQPTPPQVHRLRELELILKSKENYSLG